MLLGFPRRLGGPGGAAQAPRALLRAPGRPQPPSRAPQHLCETPAPGHALPGPADHLASAIGILAWLRRVGTRRERSPGLSAPSGGRIASKLLFSFLTLKQFQGQAPSPVLLIAGERTPLG